MAKPGQFHAKCNWSANKACTEAVDYEQQKM